MGWRLLRFLICFIVIFWIMIYIAPKSVLTARWHEQSAIHCLTSLG